MAHKRPIGRKASDNARSRAGTLVATFGPSIPALEAANALLAATVEFAKTGWLPDSHANSCDLHQSVGRKAGVEARDAAQELIDCYGPALSNPAGRYCINPADAPEDHIHVSAEQAAHALLRAWRRFVDTGWLVETEVKLEGFMIREDYKPIRANAKTSKEAIERLAKIYPRSIRDLERIVGRSTP